MALNEAPKYGKEYRFGILPESTYGTTPAAPICELRCEPPTIDRGINIREVKGAQGSKDPTYNERVQNASGSRASFTLTGPINGYAGGAESPLQVLAQSFFQYEAAGVYSFFDDHPSGDGVAYSYTFIRKDPTDGRDAVFAGCVNKSMDLTFERGELVTYSCDVESKNAGLIDQTIASTLAVSGSTEMAPVASFEDFTYTIDINNQGSSGITVKTVAIHHGWDEIEAFSSDGNGGYADKGFVGRQGCTFSITMLRDDQSVFADSALEKGQEVELTITAGARLAANWDITDYWATGKIDSIEYGYDGLASVTINCSMKAADASTNMCELDLS